MTHKYIIIDKVWEPIDRNGNLKYERLLEDFAELEYDCLRKSRLQEWLQPFQDPEDLSWDNRLREKRLHINWIVEAWKADVKTRQMRFLFLLRHFESKDPDRMRPPRMLGFVGWQVYCFPGRQRRHEIEELYWEFDRIIYTKFRSNMYLAPSYYNVPRASYLSQEIDKVAAEVFINEPYPVWSK